MNKTIQTHTINITDMAFPNNWGVGRIDKKVVFVPDGMVGDTVTVELVRGKKKLTFGKIIQIDIPSPLRVDALCKHNSVCGGCVMQELNYEKQLELKQNYLIQSFKKENVAGILHHEDVSIVPSPERWYYRNKMEFTFGEDNGDIKLGMMKRTMPYEWFSGKVNGLEHCFIFSEIVDTLFPIVVDFVTHYGYVPFNLRRKEGFVRNLVVREGKNTGELMIAFVTTSGEIPHIKSLYESIKDVFASLTSFYWIENNRMSNVFDVENIKAVYGNPYIEEKLHDKRFRIYPLTFFQTNTHAAELLHTEIIKSAKLSGAEHILGLFCGAGAIEISLAPYAKQIIGIDINAVNIANARENCEINGISNCTFYEGRVDGLLNTISFEQMDLVIIDPPRAGLSKKSLKRIKRLNIPRIVYVSCNPATLARDVKSFEDDGYCLEYITAFDFFPHTGHMETLVCLGK